MNSAAQHKRHALVVDDSATARATLRRMLEAYGLAVDTAVSAEDALDCLERGHPDVIFMDHQMPGMDGLQAVRVIKEDPTTAMIPIMMYTSREGEVYVSEARALGAVGVLSKEVKPVELLEVLRGLHVVEDPDNPDSSGIRQAVETVEEFDSAGAAGNLESVARGAAVDWERDNLRSVIQPLLNDQRHRLRRELTSISGNLARQAAEEILRRKADLEATAPADRGTAAWFGEGRGKRLALGIAAVALVLGVFRFVEREQAPMEAAVSPAPAPAMEQELEAAERPLSAPFGNIDDAMRAQMGTLLIENAGLYSILEWLANRDGQYPYDETPLGNHTLKLVRGLIERLAAIGFKGMLQIDTHVGQFCLQRIASGALQWPAEDASLAVCEMVNSDPAEARLFGEQQSVAFANFLGSSPAVVSGDIQVRIVSHGRDDPLVEPPDPDPSMPAMEWNRIALQNNRVGFTIVPEQR